MFVGPIWQLVKFPSTLLGTTFLWLLYLGGLNIFTLHGDDLHTFVHLINPLPPSTILLLLNFLCYFLFISFILLLFPSHLFLASSMYFISKTSFWSSSSFCFNHFLFSLFLSLNFLFSPEFLTLTSFYFSIIRPIAFSFQSLLRICNSLTHSMNHLLNDLTH